MCVGLERCAAVWRLRSPATASEATPCSFQTVVDVTLPQPLGQFEFLYLTGNFIDTEEPHVVATVDFTQEHRNPITHTATLTRGHGHPLLSSNTGENKTGRLVPVRPSDGAIRKTWTSRVAHPRMDAQTG